MARFNHEVRALKIKGTVQCEKVTGENPRKVQSRLPQCNGIISAASFIFFYFLIYCILLPFIPRFNLVSPSLTAFPRWMDLALQLTGRPLFTNMTLTHSTYIVWGVPPRFDLIVRETTVNNYPLGSTSMLQPCSSVGVAGSLTCSQKEQSTQDPSTAYFKNTCFILFQDILAKSW